MSAVSGNVTSMQDPGKLLPFEERGKRRLPKVTEIPLTKYVPADDSAGSGPYAFNKYVQVEKKSFGQGSIGLLVSLAGVAAYVLVMYYSFSANNALHNLMMRIPGNIQFFAMLAALIVFAYPGYRISKGCEDVHVGSDFAVEVFMYAVAFLLFAILLVTPFILMGFNMELYYNA